MIPGVLEPLDNYITPEFDIADFEPTLLNAFQQDGKIHIYPKIFLPLHCFTKKAFQAAELSQPPKLGQNCANNSRN